MSGDTIPTGNDDDNLDDHELDESFDIVGALSDAILNDDLLSDGEKALLRKPWNTLTETEREELERVMKRYKQQSYERSERILQQTADQIRDGMRQEVEREKEKWYATYLSGAREAGIIDDVDIEDDEEDVVIELSPNATFKDLRDAIERMFSEADERGDANPDEANDLLWSEIHDWRPDLADRLFELISDPQHLEEAAQISVLAFFAEEGEDRSDVEVFLPIQFKETE